MGVLRMCIFVWVSLCKIPECFFALLWDHLPSLRSCSWPLLSLHWQFFSSFAVSWDDKVGCSNADVS